jgi:PAS domain-containing protein
MHPQHAGAAHQPRDDDRRGAVMAVAPRLNFDWMRDPPPADLTAFQDFIRHVDWEASSIGPMASWPPELKHIVRLMMADTSPRVLYWGPTHTILYNEAYIPLVGDKHPVMQGKNAPDIFPEFWPYFDKIIAEQRSTGLCLSGSADMLLMERHGFLEETYFDWKLVPVIGDDGEVKGSYGCPSDLTRDVIIARRIDCIKHLAQQISKTTSLKELWVSILSALSINEKDAPFVLLYSVQEQPGLAALPSRPHYTCRLEGSIGAPSDHVAAKQYMDAQYDLDGFAPSVLAAITSDEILKLTASDPSLEPLLDGIGWKGYGLPSCELAIVPIKSDAESIGFFIVGLNPYRRYNQLYHDFLRSIAETVGPQISKIKLSEEVQRREEIALKATSDFQKSEQRFSRFAERSTIGLAVAGLERDIMYANDAWYRFSGLSPSRADYSGWLETVFVEDLPMVEEWWQKVLGEKKAGQFQFRTKIPFRQGNMYSDHKTAICAGKSSKRCLRLLVLIATCRRVSTAS